MLRHRQTILEPPHGNALQACAASILGLPLDDVPNFVAEKDYWAAALAHAASRRLNIIKIALSDDGRLPFPNVPGTLCITRGVSPRGSHGHVIVAAVAADGVSLEPVHDPHPDDSFLSGPAAWAAFYAAIEPALVRPPAKEQDASISDAFKQLSLDGGGGGDTAAAASAATTTKKKGKGKNNGKPGALAGKRAIEGEPTKLDGTPPLAEKQPSYLAKRADWKDLPDWIYLSDERGKANTNKPFPPLADDLLFRFAGKDGALLLPYHAPPPLTPGGNAGAAATTTPRRGAAVVCPGGNYEFLHPREGPAIARWAAEELGIPAFVLRYGVLPSCGLNDMHAQLAGAIREARRHANGGPVVCFGFSAGGHLVASGSSSDEALADKSSRADAQVLVYPCINPDGWLVEDECGFWGAEVDTDEVRSLVQGKERYCVSGGGGEDFVVPPPTFLVSSTDDWVCPPERDSDPYAKAIKAAPGGVVEHVRGAFGDHGFGLKRFWADKAATWLREVVGVGAEVQAEAS